MKRLFVILLSIVVHQCASAAVIRVSQLAGLNTGNLGADSTTGQQEGWNNPTAQVTVTNGSSSLDGTGLGLVVSAGGRAFASATTALNVRNQFANSAVYPTATTDTNLYYSFLYRFRNAADVSADGEIIVRLNTYNSGTGSAQHWDLIARNVAGQIQVGIFKAGATQTNYATTNINAGETFFVVVRQQMVPGTANDTNSLWINPPASSFGADEANIPPPAAMTSDGAEASGSGPGRLVFVAGANSEFDELRITTTWAEATPQFGSCVGAGIENSPTDVTLSEGLAATFSVRALGSATSPTIRWQLSTNAGSAWADISGATSDSYRTPNLSLVNSNNKYRAIVSVLCNSSSATSAVATVTVTNPIVTPVGIIMNDTFRDTDSLGFDDRANAPLTSTNSLWYTATTDNLIADQNGNMLGTPLSTGASLWLGYFIDTNQPPVDLAVGRTLKVTLPFTPSSFSGQTNNAGLRFGLYDYYDSGNRILADGATAGGSAGNALNVRGYMLVVDFGATFTDETPLEIYARNNFQSVNLMGTTSDYESLGNGPSPNVVTNVPSFIAGQQYTLELLVKRTGFSSAEITASLGNWNITVTDTNYAYHRFDAFGIRPERSQLTADSFTIPEFKVEVLQGSVAVSPFQITSVQSLAPNSIKLTWNSESGASYHVLSTPSLATPSWTTNATVLATSSSTSYTNTPATAAERYYRVVGLPYP